MTDRRAAPVGVFDSGVGGLSVLRELRELLPSEDFVYVADSAHCPYGGRPHAEIRDRALAIGRLLVGQGCKALVVACNTASVAALDTLRGCLDVPVVGMEPAVKPAAAATRSGVVGVLATGATLAGERFASLAERYAEGITLLTQACPGLVEQVEAGDLAGPRTVDLLRRYVRPLQERGADTIVLGCTHYPFLRSTLGTIVGPRVTLVDTGAAVARQTRRVLLSHGLDRVDEMPGHVRFLTSGSAAEAVSVISRLWGEPVRVESLSV